MRKIKLTQGKYTLVDDWNYTWLNQYKWYALKNYRSDDYYAVRAIRIDCKNRKEAMARQILGLEFGNELKADHINFNTLDNREENLRICSHAENQHNRKIQKGRTSEYKGVCWHKRQNKWIVQIGYNGKLIHCGYFHSEVEAAKVYNNAAIKYHKEFAYLNQI